MVREPGRDVVGEPDVIAPSERHSSECRRVAYLRASPCEGNVGADTPDAERQRNAPEPAAGMADLSIRLALVARRICNARSGLERILNRAKNGDGLPSRSSFAGEQARLRVASRRYGAASFAGIQERRMVDLTGIEPVTS